jgi:iron complex outermembrane receptor protein
MRVSFHWRRGAAALAIALLSLAAPAARLFATAPEPAPAPAETEPGTLTGTVKRTNGDPLANAQVRLVELNRRTFAGADGSFRFEGVPAGSYLVEATDPRLGAAVERIAVPSNGTADVDLTLDLTVHRDEIVVTASPDPRSQDELAVATAVIAGDELQRRSEATLGETLNKEPGISSTFFGPGASRPVIRGLGGDRIRILESGLGTGDASTTSPDHAVSNDPISAERIEIVRGPATLLYGSSAVGGVVNVIDGRIPDFVPEERVSGNLDLRGGSNADERLGNISLTGGAGKMAFHLEGFQRQTDDYESGAGRVVNSALDSKGGSAGLSYVGASGFLGASASRFDTIYGNPAEEEVTIDMKQRRADLQGQLNGSFGFLKGLKVRAGKSDYEHVELEGSEVGTRFTNESTEARIEALQRQVGPLTGSFGLQLGRRDFAAIGEEAFVPQTRTDSWALFTFQEIQRGDLRYQLGARYERQQADADVTEGIDRRDLNAASGSVGLVWSPGELFALSLSAARSTKLPNAEELFSNGPHIATQAFEIGDPTLDEEISQSVELSLRKRNGRLTGQINFFANRFDGFIYEQPTDEVIDDLQVIRFVQRDADFRGAEISGVFELLHAEPSHLDAEFGADYVRAELRDTGEPLPRIPPYKLRLGLHYQGEKLQGLVEGQRVARQDRISRFETETAGYTLLNASLGYRFFVGERVLDLLLRGNNLTDELAFNHVSFLKTVAPLPGRDFSLGLKLAF